MPHAIHAALPQASKDGFPQFYAKNVGIRRARGEFVFVTNGDVLISAELVGVLARKELDVGSFYRIDRHDLLERFHPAIGISGDMIAACEGATKKVLCLSPYSG